MNRSHYSLFAQFAQCELFALFALTWLLWLVRSGLFALFAVRWCWTAAQLDVHWKFEKQHFEMQEISNVGGLSCRWFLERYMTFINLISNRSDHIQQFEYGDVRVWHQSFKIEDVDEKKIASRTAGYHFELNPKQIKLRLKPFYG